LIKIKEDTKKESSVATKIVVTLENNEEKAFEGYPITLKPKEITPLIYEMQKSAKTKSK
jgi:hypothetical protein